LRPSPAHCGHTRSFTHSLDQHPAPKRQCVSITLSPRPQAVDKAHISIAVVRKAHEAAISGQKGDQAALKGRTG